AGLVTEHLGADPDAVAAAIDEAGVIAAIRRFKGGGQRGLRPLQPRRVGPLGAWLSRSRFFDPRYRRSAQGRLGLTNRHLFLALGGLGLAAVLLARRTR